MPLNMRGWLSGSCCAILQERENVLKVEQLATQLNVPDEVVEKTRTSLGMKPGQELKPADLDRIRTHLETDYPVDPSAFERLKATVSTPTAPTPPAPRGSGDSTGVGRLDLSAFGSLGRTIAARGDRHDLILQRKTRNCGDTAGLVLDGLRKHAPTTTERDVSLAVVLEHLSKPASEHQVWDITVHQHTFTLERHPDGSNLLIQSYQPGYNVQHWCGLEDPYLDNQDLADLPNDWFKPTDGKVATLGDTIRRLYEGDRVSQKEIWTELPFNPQDPLVVSDRMETLAFAANLIRFDEPSPMGASLVGLQNAMAELSG